MLSSVSVAVVGCLCLSFFFFKQKTAYEMRISDWSSDVCSSDLDYLAVGYLLNQNMLKPDDVIEAIDHDEELDVVVVRTERATNYEEKLKKKVRTSGCAQGTVFGDLMEKFETVKLPADAVLKTSWLATLSKQNNAVPSLYLED